MPPALRDWRDRRGFAGSRSGASWARTPGTFSPCPGAAQTEVSTLVGDSTTSCDEASARREVARRADWHLTEYIAGITGQRVRTSAEVRGFALVGLAFPSALGACDILTGDVAIFKDVGFLEPHIIAHEFCHRKGYWKELEAQALAYLALAGSGDPVLVQAAPSSASTGTCACSPTATRRRSTGAWPPRACAPSCASRSRSSGGRRGPWGGAWTPGCAASTTRACA
jgi:hypothetical protein